MKRLSIVTVSMICLTGLYMVKSMSRGDVRGQDAEIVSGVEAEDARIERAYTRTCSNASLKGTYGLSFTGTVDGLGPGGALGTLTFDGDGHMRGSGTALIMGITRQGTVSGSYSVDPDCTGEASLISSGGLKAVGSFVIVGGGKEVMFIGARPEGSVPVAFLSGSAKKL